MSEESLVSPVRESGPQPVEHRPAKAYVSPSLKVYGKAVDLTASGTGPLSEGFVTTTICSPDEPTRGPCHP